MNTQELYKNATEAKNTGNDMEALKLLSEIIENHPNSQEAELARAMRYNINNKDDVAVSSDSTSGASYSSDYGVARSISQVISILGWVVVAVGIIAAFSGLLAGNRYGGGVSLIGILPGLGIAISGLFLVVAGQITRATVDNADHTREILKLIKEKS